MKLLDLQQAMRTGIVGTAPGALAQAILADGIAPERRIQVYRNHYYVTLIEALAATFPVTHRLVGERFFAAVARRFAAASPPAGPCLFEYGDGFPALLESLPEAKAHPYLGDVARLEWTMNLSRTAPGGAARPGRADLCHASGLPSVRLALPRRAHLVVQPAQRE